MVRTYVHTPYQMVFPGSNRLKMRQADLSLILNYIETLKDIEKNFLNGMFCIFESDVDLLPNHLDVGDLFTILKEKMGSWDLVHFGSTGDNSIKSQMWNPGYIEDLTKPGDKVRLELHWSTRSTDTHIISMEGLYKQLNWFNRFVDYCMPIDYMITEMLKTNLDFKYYWSDPAYFFQRSNMLLEKSNIKDDNEQLF